MTDSLKIALARPLPPAMHEALSQFGEVLVAGADPDAMTGCHIYVSTAVDPVTTDMIKAMPDSIGMIGNLGVGTNNIDLAAAAERGIEVSNTPVVTEDTADLAFALLMATCRRVTFAETHLRADDWATGAQVLGTRVHGKTLGIIGLGAIGQAVARRAKGFGMSILYSGRKRNIEAEQILQARYCDSVDELLANSDIVSLHCPLTEHTQYVINAERLAKMKPGAILINTGRGPLVDEAALIDALQAGHLGGAGLDVFEFEPEVSPGLLTLDNVTLTPHIGSATAECRRDMAMRLLGNIKAFLESGKVLDRCLP